MTSHHASHEGAAIQDASHPSPANPGSSLARSGAIGATGAFGTTRYQAVKGRVGTGSRSGGGILHFGLGPDLSITEAELFAPGGASIATRTDVPSNQVTPLSP